jgi:hypothetical protein
MRLHEARAGATAFEVLAFVESQNLIFGSVISLLAHVPAVGNDQLGSSPIELIALISQCPI